MKKSLTERGPKMGKGTSAAIVLTAVLALTACSGDIPSATPPSGKSGCGAFNVAVNPWVGYEADAYVVGTVAREKLGCTVNYKTLKEEVSWQGFGSGEVDTVLENWGHPELADKYIKQQKTAVDAGPTGNTGVIGWYVPPWMAKQYPDITDSKNLNKYADLFKTSESGGTGPTPRRRPLLCHQRRSPREEPRPQLQGCVRGQ